jgi:hypothetical protein
MKKKRGNVDQRSTQLTLTLVHDEGRQPSSSVVHVAGQGSVAPIPVVATTAMVLPQTTAIVTNLASVRSERVRDILIEDLIRTRVPAKQA